MTKQAAIETLSFEDALGELEGIVRTLEKGETPLENSIAAYERGRALKEHCEARLNEARMKIEKLTAGPSGKLTAEPLDKQ
jgi:exodeoxyribonuclease VII small subunit